MFYMTKYDNLIDLLIDSSFNSKVIETGLSDHHKLTITVIETVGV